MNALILMTRIPIPGKTKTRLMGLLTGEECARIHYSFLQDLFSVCDLLKDELDIYITYTPEGNLSIIKNIIPEYIEAFPQQGEDLGERMGYAINKLLKKYNKVVLIGTDIPELQPHHIKEAFDVLDDKDICLGPTVDGGYYLVGMKKTYDEIFNNNIAWGKKSVLEGTIDIANRRGLKVGLSSKCRDIDTKDDLKIFLDKIKDEKIIWEAYPHNTVSFINSLDEERYINA
ncbi:MAG: glycosyltransferase [Clostridiaceae bacterium]|nr:glycosyltransferase [Clostridiaceae bacterium]